DISGNTSSCTSTVTVLDTTAPVINCPSAKTLDVKDNCAVSLPDYGRLTAVTDNCGLYDPSLPSGQQVVGGIIVSQSPAPATNLLGPGLRVVTLTATDGSGNSKQCQFDV